MRTSMRRAGLSIGLSLLASWAHADVILSTFGPGDSYLLSPVRRISGAAIPLVGYNGTATTFTPGSDYTFDSAELAMSHQAATNSYKFTLAPDVGGQPGTPLESWVLSLPGTASVVQIPSTAHPVLSAGATYWLVAQPTAANQFGFWYVNDQGINTGSVKSQITSSSTAWTSISNPDLAYRIKGTPLSAPEPGTFALLAAGFVAGAFLRRNTSY